jgi:hypothetical protein
MFVSVDRFSGDKAIRSGERLIFSLVVFILAVKGKEEVCAAAE